MSKKSKKQAIPNSTHKSPAHRHSAEAEQQQSIQSFSQQEYYQGALPHPDHFARFESICPGAADRILQLTEREQQAAHKQLAADRALRERVMVETIKDNRLKRATALFALGFCLAASVALAFLHAPAAAAIVGGTTVAGVVASFLKQTASKESSNASRK